MKKYILPFVIFYHSKRYYKNITVEKGFESDGATGASDIYSKAWWIHDKICETGIWDDGSKISNWQASTILCDVLRGEGRWVRALTWFLPTFLFGGGKCRKNGMFKVKNG